MNHITRGGITVCILFAVTGCSTPENIPAPTANWSYIQIEGLEKIKEAEVCLLLSYNRKGESEATQQAMFFQREGACQNLFSSLSTLSFTNEAGLSVQGDYQTEVCRNNITIHVRKYYIYEDVYYEFEEDIEITYSNTGKSSAGHFDFSWEWIKLDSRRQWNKLSKRTSVDWLEI